MEILTGKWELSSQLRVPASTKAQVSCLEDLHTYVRTAPVFIQNILINIRTYVLHVY